MLKPWSYAFEYASFRRKPLRSSILQEAHIHEPERSNCRLGPNQPGCSRHALWRS
jgi:hypothetical protein